MNSGNDHNAFKSHGAAEVMGVSARRPKRVMDPTHTNAPNQGNTDLGNKESKNAAPKDAPAATGASLGGKDRPSSPSKLFTKNTANNMWNAIVAEENHLASPSIWVRRAVAAPRLRSTKPNAVHPMTLGTAKAKKPAHPCRSIMMRGRYIPMIHVQLLARARPATKV